MQIQLTKKIKFKIKFISVEIQNENPSIYIAKTTIESKKYVRNHERHIMRNLSTKSNIRYRFNTSQKFMTAWRQQHNLENKSLLYIHPYFTYISSSSGVTKGGGLGGRGPRVSPFEFIQGSHPIGFRYDFSYLFGCHPQKFTPRRWHHRYSAPGVTTSSHATAR